MRAICLLCSLTAALVTVGCSNTPPPPPDTRAADMQAVKDVETAWSKDAQTRDADKFATYFADDAVGLYPGMAALSGKQAIKTALAPIFADPNFAMEFHSTKTDASKGGDIVYSLGVYTMTMTDAKTKKPVHDKGKYLTVYQKQADGSWKAVADTFNSDTAM